MDNITIEDLEQDQQEVLEKNRYKYIGILLSRTTNLSKRY